MYSSHVPADVWCVSHQRQVAGTILLPYRLRGQTPARPSTARRRAAYFEGTVSPWQQASAVQIVSGGIGPRTQSPPQHSRPPHVKPSQHSSYGEGAVSQQVLMTGHKKGGSESGMHLSPQQNLPSGQQSSGVGQQPPMNWAQTMSGGASSGRQTDPQQDSPSGQQSSGGGGATLLQHAGSVHSVPGGTGPGTHSPLQQSKPSMQWPIERQFSSSGGGGGGSFVQQASSLQVTFGGSGRGTQSPPQHARPSQHSYSPQQTSSSGGKAVSQQSLLTRHKGRGPASGMHLWLQQTEPSGQQSSGVGQQPPSKRAQDTSEASASGRHTDPQQNSPGGQQSSRTLSACMRRWGACICVVLAVGSVRDGEIVRRQRPGCPWSIA